MGRRKKPTKEEKTAAWWKAAKADARIKTGGDWIADDQADKRERGLFDDAEETETTE